MSEMSRTPQETAEHLASSLDANTSELTAVREELRLVKERNKLLTWVSVAVSVSLLVAIVAIGLIVKFNYDGNVDRCESGNELRIEENNKWDSIADILRPALSANGLDEDDKAFLVVISSDHEIRDCSNLNWLGQ